MKAIKRLFGSWALLLLLSSAAQANPAQINADSLWISTSTIEKEEGDALSYNGKSLQCRIIERKNNVIAIHYATANEGLVKIKIVNEATNQAVYIDKIMDQSLVVKKYDLSHLPAGKYLVEVIYGSEIAAKFIQVTQAADSGK